MYQFTAVQCMKANSGSDGSEQNFRFGFRNALWKFWNETKIPSKSKIFAPRSKNSENAFRKFHNKLEFCSEFWLEQNGKPEFVLKSMHQSPAVQCMKANSGSDGSEWNFCFWFRKFRKMPRRFPRRDWPPALWHNNITLPAHWNLTIWYQYFILSALM